VESRSVALPFVSGTATLAISFFEGAPPLTEERFCSAWWRNPIRSFIGSIALPSFPYQPKWTWVGPPAASPEFPQ
jgi:hypothetical protein